MIHQYDPNTRWTTCGLQAWPYRHEIHQAQLADDSFIEVSYSRRGPTCPRCLDVIRAELEKRNDRIKRIGIPIAALARIA